MQSICIWIVHVDEQELYMYMYVVTRVHICYMTLHVHVYTCIWMHVYRYNLETDRFGTAVNSCWKLHVDKHFWGLKTKIIHFPYNSQQLYQPTKLSMQLHVYTYILYGTTIEIKIHTCI